MSSSVKISNASLSGAFVRTMDESFAELFSRTQNERASEPVSQKDRNDSKPVVIIGEVAGWSERERAIAAAAKNHQGHSVGSLSDYPYNFSKGFVTLEDFWTVYHKRDTGLGGLIIEVNSVSGAAPLASVDKVYTDMEHGATFDFDPVLKYLLSEGFMRYNLSSGAVTLVKFNALNLPTEFMFIRTGSSKKRGDELIDGWVTQERYKRIQAFVMPQLVKKETNLTLSLLSGYSFDKNGGFQGGELQTQHLSPNMDYALESFYPWITTELRGYFEEFLNSRSNVLILIGPPGTGKSTLIRTMIRNLNASALLAYKPDVITSGYFLQVCREFFHANANTEETDVDGNVVERPTAVVVEDADVIMSKRNLGNMQMAELLNATSGIVSDTNSKFILSTNLKDTDDIDPALLRQGRCFDILCFRDLTAAESAIIRKARGLKPREFDPKRKYRLAEVLNSASTQGLSEPVIKPRFGFQA